MDLYSVFFRVLYNATYLSINHSELALKILGDTKFAEGLRAGVPEHVAIAHKFGYRRMDGALRDTPSSQLHDCGIVYYPNKPYFICVMTKGNNINDLKAFIGEVSEAVYRDVEKN